MLGNKPLKNFKDEHLVSKYVLATYVVCLITRVLLNCIHDPKLRDTAMLVSIYLANLEVHDMTFKSSLIFLGCMKAALESVTIALAAELAPHKVT